MLNEDTVISLAGISKMYPIYNSPFDRLKEVLSFRRGIHHREFWALNDVSLDVYPGETVGIIGENGSGKSTLLQIACGLMRPTHGQIHVQGRISALLELGSGFNPELPGRDNVYMQGAILGLDKAEMEGRMQRILDFSEIGEFIDQPVKNYSSGMMMRLAFSVAVQVDPEILIVDEALAVGDVFFQSKCFRRLEDLRAKGVTILLVTHQLGTVVSLCDRAIFLDHGRKLAEGLPKAVVDEYYRYKATCSGRRDFTAEQGSVESEDQSFRAPPGAPPSADGPSRYGNGKARIESYSLNGYNNILSIPVNSAEPLVVRVTCKANEYIPRPVFGIRINTIEGFQVYGLNTTFAGMPMDPLQPGQEVCLEFTQTLYLHRGQFLLTIVIGEWDANGKVIFVDRLVDAASINVTGGPYPYAGLCNLQGAITRISL